MMNVLKTVRVLSLWVLSLGLLGATAAHAQSSDFSYTYLEGGYLNVDLDNPNADGDGLFLGGSVLVADTIILSADFDYVDFNRGIDIRTIELGVGVPLPLAPGFDIVVEGGYLDASVDTPFGNFDDDGFFAGALARWMVNDQVELNGGLKYVDLDESGDDVVVHIGGLVNVRPNLAVLAGVDFADDTDALSIGFRYYVNGNRR
jgi:hypothetical protein